MCSAADGKYDDASHFIDCSILQNPIPPIGTWIMPIYMRLIDFSNHDNQLLARIAGTDRMC
jgi:hypothetical protein